MEIFRPEKGFERFNIPFQIKLTQKYQLVIVWKY